jgi:hypothetical protein
MAGAGSGPCAACSRIEPAEMISAVASGMRAGVMNVRFQGLQSVLRYIHLP